MPLSPAPAIPLLSSTTLEVVLRLEPGGPVVDREPVAESDLVDHASELWFAECLRKGRPDVALADLAVKLAPIFKEDGAPGCAGLELEAVLPDRAKIRRFFSASSLQDVARRVAERLLHAGLIAQEDAAYYYEVLAERKPAGPAPAPTGAPFTMTMTSAPVSYLRAPLGVFLAAAKRVGPVEDEAPKLDLHHVFYTAAAAAMAERHARRGGKKNPPEETGGVLVGPLCSCPETGEMFSVVTDVLEAI